MTNKIIFLDIDGVLNSHNSGTFYSLDHPENYSINEELWNHFKRILDKFPEISVVIHSGWIKHADEPNYEWDMGCPEKGIKVKTLFPKVVNRLGDRYIGHVDYIKGKPKSVRIEKWLRDHDILENFDYKVLIIDDDDSEYTNLFDLVKKYSNVYVYFTDSDRGLDSTAFKELVNLIRLL